MITGVLLNWKRPQNVRRIVAGWNASGLVSETITWNNNPAAPLTPLPGAKVINAAQDMGLYTRFAAACMARNPCILIQDDDLELPQASLAALYTAWQTDPDVLHGMFGRAPKRDGSYARNIQGDADAPVILTRVLLAHRRYAADFFDVAPEFDAIQREGKPVGNGEDILFSYTVQRHTGRWNRVHRLPVNELPAPHSIHGRNWSAHLKHRTCLLRACEAWLKGESYEDRRDLLHV